MNKTPPVSLRRTPGAHRGAETDPQPPGHRPPGFLAAAVAAYATLYEYPLPSPTEAEAEARGPH